jgi:hypothetical protein
MSQMDLFRVARRIVARNCSRVYIWVAFRTEFDREGLRVFCATHNPPKASNLRFPGLTLMAASLQCGFH